MIDEDISFFNKEKEKFNELLNKLHWTEDGLLKEQDVLIQCPIDRGHRFPIRSKHEEKCRLRKEGVSDEYLKEVTQCEQEKQLLNQSGILFTPTVLSDILHRPVTISNNIPLSIEHTTVLFTPEERSLIAQAVHNEAVRLNIVPSTPLSMTDSHFIQSQNPNISQQLNKLSELRDQKRRRIKYVTRTTKKSFYDIAREMINTKMEFIRSIYRHEKDQIKPSKRKHRSSSKKKHRSHSSHKHHRHSKKRRRS